MSTHDQGSFPVRALVSIGVLHMFPNQLPKSAKDRLIFALDVERVGDAERLVRLMAPHVGMFKVGPRIFTSAGALVLDLIHGMGSSTFLDLKFYDIPATVGGAAKEVGRHRAAMFSLHALGGRRMIECAVRELGRMTLIPGVPPPMCLAITMLTSYSQEDIEELGFTETIADIAQRLARVAVEAGADGVVASGHEIAKIRAVVPKEAVIVTPGIRASTDKLDDQTRVMSAGEAVQAGATYVVVGRPIRLAQNPVDAAKRIVDDIAQALA